MSGDDAPPADEPVSDAEVLAFLQLPSTREVLRERIAKRVPKRDVEDRIQETLASVLQRGGRPSSRDKLAAWLCGVAGHIVADHYRKQAVRTGLDAEYAEIAKMSLREMPAVREDVLVVNWLMRAVQDDPHDAETLDFVRDKVFSGKTYGEVAGERGLPEEVVIHRVGHFRAKYAPLKKAHLRRLRMLGLLCMLLALVAYAIYRWARPTLPAAPPIPPTTLAPPPPARPTSTASVFEPAGKHTPSDEDSKK